jgi:hypothetical protein
MAVLFHWSGSASGGWTNPTGYTLRSDNTVGNDTAVWTKTLSSGSPDDPASVNANTSDQWVAHTFTIAPVSSTTHVTTTWQSSYVVRDHATTTWQSSYVVRDHATTTWASSYAVRKHLTTTWASSYVARIRPTITWQSSYVVRDHQTTTWQSSYVVRDHVTTTWQSSYGVGGRLASSWASSYVIRHRVATTWQSSYAVKIKASTTWQSSFVVRDRSTTTWQSSFVVRDHKTTTWQSSYTVASDSGPGDWNRVSATGSELATDGTPAFTVTSAATLATAIAAASAGDVIQCNTASYGTFAGTSKAVVIKATPGHTPSIALNLTNGDANFTIDGFFITGADFTGTPGPHDITISNCNSHSSSGAGGLFEVDGPEDANILIVDHEFTAIGDGGDDTEAAIRFSYGPADSGFTIKRCNFHDMAADGVKLGAAAIIEDCIFDAVTPDDPDKHTDAIQLFDGDGATIRRSFFTGCEQSIGGFDGTQECLIEDNVVVDGDAHWITLMGDDPASIVRHNTVIGGDIYLSSKSGAPSSKTYVLDNIADGVALTGTVVNGTPSANTHNMFPSGASGSNFNGTPTFVGGATPTTWAGYELDPDSDGVGAASDGHDVGIRVTTPDHVTQTWASSYKVRDRVTTTWQSSFGVRHHATTSWQSSYTVSVIGSTHMASTWVSSYKVRKHLSTTWASSYVVRDRVSTTWRSSYTVEARVTTTWRSSYAFEAVRITSTWTSSYAVVETVAVLPEGTVAVYGRVGDVEVADATASVSVRIRSPRLEVTT